MKILVPTSPYTSTGYPIQPGTATGGLQTVSTQIVDALVEMGHEVTLYTDKDFFLGSEKVEQVKGDYTSTVNAKNTSVKKWTEGWIKEALNPKYERVIINDTIFNLKDSLEDFRKVCKKTSMVYHSYDELIDMSFMAPQIQTLMEVMENGGGSLRSPRP